MLEFNVLGPLEVRRKEVSHRIYGACQRILLAALLAHEGQVATREALMDELWGTGRPESPDNALQADISRLRRQLAKLEPERRRSRLRGHGAGYRLVLDDAEFDARTFIDSMREVDRHAPAWSPEQSVVRIRAAISRWRGQAFAGVTGGRICQGAHRRYERARLRALESLFDAELQLGNHRLIVPELHELIGTYSPHQERFGEQLMISLYRSGRQAKALEICRRVGKMLRDAGATPSGRLHECEQAILRHDSRLAMPAPAVPIDRAASLLRTTR